MKKVSRYTEDDVQRWESVNSERLKSTTFKVLNESQHLAVSSGRGWNKISLMCISNAQTCIAQGEFSPALGWLGTSVDVECCLFEVFHQGEEISIEYLSAGCWQVLLNAHASCNRELVRRFNDLFDLEIAARPEAKSTKDSMYHARLLKALTECRIDVAKEILREKHPSVEAMFRGYIECMEMIALGDEKGFRGAIADASVAWERYARRVWKHLPDSVCFLNGVGLIRLAEHVWGYPVMIKDSNIPDDLLGDFRPEKIDLEL